MNMQIGQLMRTLLGETASAETRSMELKVGQIVKGMVLELLSEQDALVNIGGMVIRAKLETPLRQGQVTLLQVQPQSNGSQTVLKPLPDTTGATDEEGWTHWLLQQGVKGDAAMMAKQIRSAGIPFTSELAATLQQALTPEAGGETVRPFEQRLEAAIVAIQRNLPMTAQTVRSLEQAMFGSPLHAQLLRLEQQLLASRMVPLPEAVETLLHTVQRSMDAVKQLLQQAPGHLAAAPGHLAAVSADTASSAPGTPRPTMQDGAAGKQTVTGFVTQYAPAGAAQTPSVGMPAIAGSSTLPAPAVQQAAAQTPHAVADVPPNDAYAEKTASSIPAAESNGRTDSFAQTQSTSHAAAESRPAPVSQQLPWIGRLLQALGMQTEQHLLRDVHRDAPGGVYTGQRVQGESTLPAFLVQGQHTDSGEDRSSALVQTLKTALLQVVSAEQVPAALREEAQHTLQLLTGQQLLLVPDRTAVLAHLTLHIPFGETGQEQNATIHVQARKGSKGELDANNCRLLFDLQMRYLGSTLVDVQVLDRHVYVNVHNDAPVVTALLEGSREEIAAQIQASGYTLKTFRCTPLPVLSPVLAQPDTLQPAPTYRVPSYKGVDVRL